jgi:hypothetical protein
MATRKHDQRALLLQHALVLPTLILALTRALLLALLTAPAVSIPPRVLLLRPLLHLSFFRPLPSVPYAAARARPPGACPAALAALAARPPAVAAPRCDIGHVREALFVEEAVCELEDALFEGVGGEDLREDGAQVGERGGVGGCCAVEESAEDAQEGGVCLALACRSVPAWAGGRRWLSDGFVWRYCRRS